MEMKDQNGGKKRGRDEERVESGLENLPEAEVKRMREDLLLGILDESDPDPLTQDLDSVMKSFEEEILSAGPSSLTSSPAPVIVDLTSDSGESSLPDLGFLLEASDDELGLPPSSSSGKEAQNEDATELVRVDSAESVEIGAFWGFEEQIPSYDSFELGMLESYSGGFVAGYDDGLFDYSNVSYDPSEISDFS